MKKLKVLIPVMVIIIVIISLIVLKFLIKAEPNKQQILKDFEEQGKAKVDGLSYNINKIDIEKSKVDNNNADYWCIAELENEYYIITASAVATYSYYNQGGWIVENITDYSNIKYKAKTGCMDSQVREDCEYSISNIEHDTDLERGTDIVTIEYYDEGTVLKLFGSAKLTYHLDESEGWKYYWGEKLSFTSATIKDVMGTWVDNREHFPKVRNYINIYDKDGDIIKGGKYYTYTEGWTGMWGCTYMELNISSASFDGNGYVFDNGFVLCKNGPKGYDRITYEELWEIVKDRIRKDFN